MSRQSGYKYFFTSDWGVNDAVQLATCVVRRTSVLNHLDIAQFDALLRQSNYYVRQLGVQDQRMDEEEPRPRSLYPGQAGASELRKSRPGR
jgi:hypothetical protein